jgi:DsbC/DsbD-like thiol-disulfide interchange protein
MAAPDVAFPLPRRRDDGFSVTNIYTDRVVLPLTAAVTDAKSPVDLAVRIDLGVCETVCIPDHLEARLDVRAGEADAAAAKAIAAARALVPGPAEPGVLSVERATRSGGSDKRPVFQVAVTAPDAAKATLFIETPSDWYPGAPKLVDSSGNTATFAVNVDRLIAKTPLAGATFRVTLSAGNRAVEQVIPLQ